MSHYSESSDDLDAVRNEMILEKISEIAQRFEDNHQKTMDIVEKQGLLLQSFCEQLVCANKEITNLKSICAKLTEDLSHMRDHNDVLGLTHSDERTVSGIESNNDSNMKTLNDNLADYQNLSELSNNIDKIVITGLSNLNSIKSELKTVTQCVLDSLSVPVRDEDIVDVKLYHTNINTSLKTVSKTNCKRESACADNSISNNLVVTVRNNHLVRQIIKAKKKHRELLFDQLDARKLPSELVQKTSSKSVINVNEFLPRSQYQLFRKSVKLLKNIGFQSVWKQFCCVYARLSVNDPVHLIADEKQLSKIHDFYRSK